MRTSANGIELIKHFEGFMPTPYLCPANLLTIGYGHMLSADEKTAVNKLQDYHISKPEAEALLRHDLLRFEQSIKKLINIKLNQNQFDALISFTFNLGPGALQRSTLRQKINRSEHALAALEFRKWINGGGKKLPGLILRRAAESELYLK